MFYTDLSENQLRQCINAEQALQAFHSTKMRLLSAPKFRQTVIGSNGKFAEMLVPDPRAFVLFKAWMSKLENREAKKKPRDMKQARALAELIAERMPQLRFDKLHGFPDALRQPFA